MDGHLTETVRQMVEQSMSIAREAAEIQMKYFRSGHLDVRTKFGESDIVTRADRESEKLIIDRIRSLYPDHDILSEESGEMIGGSDWLWVIDPLDGTTNYTAGLPLFAVSIGIVHRGMTVGGAVYMPVTGEMFSAVKGEAALMNGEPVRVRDNNMMERAVISTGFPVDKNLDPDNNIDNVARVLPKIRGLRRLGAAAVDLCYVAAGFLDGYWELDLHPWDVCAGRLIVEQAGGMTDLIRANRGVSIVAASPGIFSELNALLR